MLFSIKNRQELEDLEDLASKRNQVEEVRLQDKLGKQNFGENIKKVFEPVTDTIKNTSEKITKAMMLTSKEKKAIKNFNDKLLEIIDNRVIIASYLLSPLYKTTKPKNTVQFKIVKKSNSKRINDLLIHNTKPVILFNNLLTFRDTVEKFEIKGDPLKVITFKNYSVDLASLSDKKLT